ncbi:hypothetical protein C8J57DRAFT_1348597 [Mycena rebaudengoi]|nr:hypothetical protein C8J57DRAFT_1348597 [Mycena rebaudengoi]
MRFLITFVLVFGVVVRAVPEDQVFEWGFTGDQAQATTLPSCQMFPIQAGPRKAHGVPPFYMISIPVGGTPITSFIGTNESDLAWQVRHPVDSQLALSVVDSQGTSGGVDPPLYNVTAGESTQCILTPTASTPPFTITANVSDAVDTCQPWGLTISGGTRPYNLTLAALNAPVLTNVTLGANDSVFTYINRAEPGTQILAAVSDLNGQWATGSPMVRTHGSTDVNCTGLVSSSGPGAPVTQPPGSGPQKHHSLSRTQIGLIAGLGGAALLILCSAAVWCVRRRRRRLQLSESKHSNIDLYDAAPAAYGRQVQMQMGAQRPTTPSSSVTPSSSFPPSSSFMRPVSSNMFVSGSKTLTHHSSSHTLPRTPVLDTYTPPLPPGAQSPVLRELPPPYPASLDHGY